MCRMIHCSPHFDLNFEKSSQAKLTDHLHIHTSTTHQTMDCLEHILFCLTGKAQWAHPPFDTNEKILVADQPTLYSDDAAREFIETLRTAEHADKELEERLKSIVYANGWTERLAESILHGVEKLVLEGSKVAAAMKEAMDKATETALEFAKEHPYYTALIAAGTIIALGVLVMMAPWVLEALGFAARGPRVGKLRRP